MLPVPRCQQQLTWLVAQLSFYLNLLHLVVSGALDVIVQGLTQFPYTLQLVRQLIEMAK